MYGSTPQIRHLETPQLHTQMCCVVSATPGPYTFVTLASLEQRFHGSLRCIRFRNISPVKNMLEGSRLERRNLASRRGVPCKQG